MIEDLKGDNPKMLGFDYYHVIYAAAISIALIMGFLYVISEDPGVKKMLLIQGCFSIGLLCASYYFRSRLQEAKLERALE